MIFSFGGLSPVSTMLTIEGATPLFLAHSFGLPLALPLSEANEPHHFGLARACLSLGRPPQLAASVRSATPSFF
jgi:hypothetical protein